METEKKQLNLMSELNLERCAKIYAEQENSCYSNDYKGFYQGSKQMGIAYMMEIRRRRDLIISEPDGIVREQMISDLLINLE